MTYQHLTQAERYQIYAYRKAGFSMRGVAAELERSPSTISRELRRNRGKRGYRPLKAHHLSQQRAQESRRRFRLGATQWRTITRLIKRQWSPEQIARRVGLEDTLRVSHEWIYRFIAADRASGGQLWRHLRHARLRRRRYHSGRQHRPIIRFRVGIDQRPDHVHTRHQLGHWEGDTIHGHRRKVQPSP